MTRYSDFVPGRNPARPLPTPGSPEIRRIAAVIASDSYFLMTSGLVPAWDHRTGDLPKVPGWYIIGSEN